LAVEKNIEQHTEAQKSHSKRRRCCISKKKPKEAQSTGFKTKNKKKNKILQPSYTTTVESLSEER